MSRANATRDAWHPQTRQDREAVLFELHEVLSSPHFSNSKRYPALLRYVVENTLAGKSDLLKERTLGVEVFDRPPSYDTNTDTVVRFTAGEVRKRLSLYYLELGRKPAIQISLPAGSYIPEFIHAHDEPEEFGGGQTLRPDLPAHQLELIPPWNPADGHTHTAADVELAHGTVTRPSQARLGGSRWWIAAAAFVVIGALAAAGWKYAAPQPRAALDSFWKPVLRDQRVVMLVTGGSVFAQNNFSGVATAGKDIDYPFISLQSASAIAQVSSVLEHSEATPQLEPAASTPLTELREHPVVFLGGYNNPWTLRLLQPMRFHFAPETSASIVDAMQPAVHWERDRSLPYSGADDYAVVARFKDTTTDSWVVVLAGLGRNGTEAAAQFATSSRYMQMLRDRIGHDFLNKNVEVVVKVSVIEGKTGAPSIVAVQSW